MKKSLTLTLSLALSLALSACGAKVAVSPTLEHQLTNPLYAEQYWEDLTDRMATLITNKEYEKDSAKQSYVDSIRTQALAKAQEATKMRKEGLLGSLIGIKEQTQGMVLLREHTLFFGPGFLSYPGPSLHVYISTVLDPRDGTFPDKTAIDLGLIQSPYGGQEYTLPATAKTEKLRTVALWDDKLGRLYAFAQLAK